MDGMKRDLLAAIVENKSDSMGEVKKTILAAKLEDLYKLVKEKDIEIEVGDTTKLLGAGAFGRVYSALWKGAPVAVKIFKPETGSSEDVVNLKKAVEREAYTLDGMKDPLG